MADDNNNWPTGTPDQNAGSDEHHTDANIGANTEDLNTAPAAPADEQPTSVLTPVSGSATEQGEKNDSTSVDGTRKPEPYRLAPQYGAYAPTPQQETTRIPTPPQQGAPNAQQSGLPYQTQNNPQNMPYGVRVDQNQPNAPQGAPTAQNRNPYGVPTGNLFAPSNGTPAGPGNPNGPTQSPFGPGSPQQGQPARTPSNIIVAVVAALVAAAICLGVGYAALTNGWVKIPTSSSLSSVSSNNHGSGSATVEGGQAPNWAGVSANVSKSVVSIQTVVDQGEAKGSGAILDKEGHIVTNNHVVSGAKQIQVTLDNGDIYSAKVVGTDSTTDLAVIKLDNPPKDLTPITFANSDSMTPGEPVMAIGNPLGYDGTVTTGIVSALNRPVTVMDEENNNAIVTNAVQIDAAINPGNSGGPTFNAAGQVIGINSSIASTASSTQTAGSIGIGFAIPATLVKRVSDEIIKNGKVEHVALGVTIQSATVEADGVTRGGAVVKSVVANSPAAKAGVKTGDTIVGFNGLAVNNNYSLLGFVRAAAMESTAKLTVVRDGHTMELNVTFDQAEAAVNGNNRSDSQNNQNNNGQNDQNQNNDNNNNNDGNSDNNNRIRNNDGLIDPFGMW